MKTVTEHSTFRASPEQLAAWRRSRVEAADVYRSQLELELAAPLTAAELAGRLAGLIAREEILRTTLVHAPGLAEPVQQIHAPEERSTALQAELAGQRLRLAAPASVCDGPSLRVIAAQLMAAGPADPGLQHADYAAWKHELLEATPPGAAVEHFRQRALDLPLQLVLEHEAAPDCKFAVAGTAAVALTTAEQAALERLAKACASSRSVVCLAIYAALLARLADRDEVSLGFDDGLRDSVPANAIGPYAAALPLLLPIERSGTLERVLQSVARSCERAAVQRDGFDFAIDPPYVFRIAPAAAIDGAQVVSEHSLSSRFKLRLNVCGDRYQFEYDRNVFDDQTVSCIEAQWRALLSALCADALQPLAAIALQPVLLSPPAPAIEAASVLSMFERNARQVGDAPAVVDTRGSISYRALNAHADQLAHRFAAHGVRAGDVVALLLPRAKEAVIGILAAHKLQAAYLPLDPDYPLERLRFMLEDSGARLCVCQSAVHEACGTIETLLLDASVTPQAVTPIERSDDLDATAYLIYTSGSTGKPKGVAITQRNLSHSTQVRMAYYREPLRAYLLLSSLAFDSSVAGIFWTLAQGGKLVLPSAQASSEPSALATLCARQGVSHGLSLPSVYDALLDQPEFAAAGSLQTWIVAGEACAPSVIAKHRARLRNVRLFNEYGPTEATVWATVDEVSLGSVRESIGTPIPGTQLALINSHGAQCGVGEPGEIVLAGPSLARGYHRRPELTAERFALQRQLGARVYRTGDRACIDAAGRVRFLGRIDRQVKIRGQRVELAEIERCLAADPRVREAVVAMAPDRPAQLFAFVRSDSPKQELAAALAARLSAALPSVMQPQSIRVYSALPRTPNGKLDLAALLRAAERPVQAFEAPVGEVERVLCEVCAELLRLPRVSATSDFLELGGDSITSLQLCARAAQRGVAVAVRDVFEHKVLREIARVARLEQAAGGHALSVGQRLVLDSESVAVLERAVEQHGMPVHALVLAALGRSLPLARVVIEQRAVARGGAGVESYCTVHALGAAASEWDAQLREIKIALRTTAELTPATTADVWMQIDHGELPAETSHCRAPLWLSLAQLGSASTLHVRADGTLYTPELLGAQLKTLQLHLEQLGEHLARSSEAELDASDFPDADLDAESLAVLLDTLDR